MPPDAMIHALNMYMYKIRERVMSLKNFVSAFKEEHRNRAGAHLN